MAHLLQTFSNLEQLVTTIELADLVDKVIAIPRHDDLDDVLMIGARLDQFIKQLEAQSGRLFVFGYSFTLAIGSKKNHCACSP